MVTVSRAHTQTTDLEVAGLQEQARTPECHHYKKSYYMNKLQIVETTRPERHALVLRLS